MILHIAFAFAGLFAGTAPSHTVVAPSVIAPASTFMGGPASIRIAGKAGGDITHAEWGTVEKVELVGCVPTAQVVELTICIKDCTGKNAGLSTKGDLLTSAMLSMVANLPPGTPFTITAKVIDANKKEWPVQPAQFVWKG